ncbi:unnamed protein product [Penicillium salamii]|uniref:Cyclin-D1-binding protein 1-like N-terminal domain-containing protein n=1 Tax=Penicillium salamii TaxID=1612424 RepID=A0A9W4NLD5_9EURO|nr:unnamed protein product [Penicillium salamii]CAG8390968.1 unnamed protein product [Penicillium salamii]CAG8393470.1 unnamed protein product [Penicillium salamii]CAG8393832.1 unnamed protein product [Penicillium salamii]
MSKQLSTTFTTTLSLIEQFQKALTTPPTESADAKDANNIEPLPLLGASATALRAHVTKLSLLSITSPFTHSAIGTVLRELNESVLPSLVTAALLLTPAQYTKAFQSEVLGLVKGVLTELLSLVREVQRVDAKKEDEKSAKSDLSKAEKDVVTRATGRVWDACDVVTDVSSKGVVGFVMRRVEQWRDLVRDAVEEIEEWDPEDDDDEFMDELLGDEKEEESDDEEENAALLEHKKVTLRFLKPVAQVYPAVINNRLKNVGEAPLASEGGIKKLEALMVNLQAIPDHVDEAAGGLYEADFERSAGYLQKTRKCAAAAVDLVMAPWGAADAPADKFATWAKTWLKVVEEVSKTIGE